MKAGGHRWTVLLCFSETSRKDHGSLHGMSMRVNTPWPVHKKRSLQSGPFSPIFAFKVWNNQSSVEHKKTLFLVQSGLVLKQLMSETTLSTTGVFDLSWSSVNNNYTQYSEFSRIVHLPVKEGTVLTSRALQCMTGFTDSANAIYTKLKAKWCSFSLCLQVRFA